MEIHWHPNSEWCTVPYASHNPEVRHTVSRAWDPWVGACQVEALCFWGASAHSRVELKVFKGNPFMITEWALLASG